MAFGSVAASIARNRFDGKWASQYERAVHLYHKILNTLEPDEIECNSFSGRWYWGGKNPCPEVDFPILWP